MYLNAEPRLPALIQIGLAHAQFETIHPFLDGNGRVGRLLITFMLCQRDILTRPVLYISHYFKRHRQLYYDRLQAIRDHGAWESWLRFFLDGIAEVSNEATETARAIVALRESHRNVITSEFGRAVGNGLLLLEHLYGRPIISVPEAAEFLSVSYPAANTMIARFVAAGLLTEVTGHHRNRRFRYGPYIDLFSDP